MRHVLAVARNPLLPIIYRRRFLTITSNQGVAKFTLTIAEVAMRNPCISGALPALHRFLMRRNNPHGLFGEPAPYAFRLRATDLGV